MMIMGSKLMDGWSALMRRMHNERARLAFRAFLAMGAKHEQTD
jgi:hypothetical protein